MAKNDALEVVLTAREKREVIHHVPRVLCSCNLHGVVTFVTHGQSAPNVIGRQLQDKRAKDVRLWGRRLAVRLEGRGWSIHLINRTFSMSKKKKNTLFS